MLATCAKAKASVRGSQTTEKRNTEDVYSMKPAGEIEKDD